MIAIYSFLLFLSGFTALVFELLWLRLFSTILGSTSLAATVVGSCFFLWLGVGVWSARFINWNKLAPLKVYAALELLIGLTSVVITLFLLKNQSFLLGVFLGLESFSSVLYHFVTCSVIISIPVFMMGMTLPAIIEAVKNTLPAKKSFALIYGSNTIGAAFGVLCSGLFLIYFFGITKTAYLAGLINLFIFFVALIINKTGPKTRSRRIFENSSEDVLISKKEILIIYCFVSLSGFLTLSTQVLWLRISGFFLGERMLAISVTLFIFILALGLGSLVVSYLRTKKLIEKNSLLGCGVFIFLLYIILLSLGVYLCLQTMHNKEFFNFILQAKNTWIRMLLFFIFVYPSTFLLGLIFPLAIAKHQHLEARTSKVISTSYFLNTIFAIIGAFFTTYFAVLTLGTLGALYFLCLILLIVLFVLNFIFKLKEKMVLPVLLVFISFFICALLLFNKHIVLLNNNEELLLANEDQYGTQSLLRLDGSFLQLKNNRTRLVYDLGHSSTTFAQQIPAHISTLLAANARSVLNIGTGYGITAGTFSLYKDFEQIITVEILPFLFKTQEYYSEYNFNYWHDPRVQQITGDGRFVLASSSKKFDIISVNVLDPYLPGSSSLYSIDFWREAYEKLNEGGIYNQLFWGEDLSQLITDLQTVFSQLYFKKVYGDSYHVFAVKSTQPPITRLERITPQAYNEARKLLNTSLVAFIQNMINDSKIINQKIIAAPKRRKRTHSDNYPILEYSWFHGDARVSPFDSPLVIK